MRVLKIAVPLFLICAVAIAATSRLPFGTVFKGQDQFNRLVAKAKEGNWKDLPIGERTATVGQALVGTRYKHFTLEIDNRIESPSVNFNGMDCWTFFEISLAFARMLNVDLIAVLVAALLPWSTSGVGIGILVWLAALAATLELRPFLRSLQRPICALPT